MEEQATRIEDLLKLVGDKASRTVQFVEAADKAHMQMSFFLRDNVETPILAIKRKVGA